jgi:peptide deformylase
METPSDRVPLAERVEQLLLEEGPLPIVAAGHPVLRRRTVPYDGQLDDALLARFVQALRVTMRTAPGVVLPRRRWGWGCGSR